MITFYGIKVFTKKGLITNAITIPVLLALTSFSVPIQYHFLTLEMVSVLLILNVLIFKIIIYAVIRK